MGKCNPSMYTPNFVPGYLSNSELVLQWSQWEDSKDLNSSSDVKKEEQRGERQKGDLGGEYGGAGIASEHGKHGEVLSLWAANWMDIELPTEKGHSSSNYQGVGKVWLIRVRLRCLWKCWIGFWNWKFPSVRAEGDESHEHLRGFENLK